MSNSRLSSQRKQPQVITNRANGAVAQREQDISGAWGLLPSQSGTLKETLRGGGREGVLFCLILFSAVEAKGGTSSIQEVNLCSSGLFLTL